LTTSDIHPVRGVISFLITPIQEKVGELKQRRMFEKFDINGRIYMNNGILHKPYPIREGGNTMQVTQLFSGGRKRMAVVSLTLLLLVVFIIPVAAVQFGELDGDDHPHVGLLVFDVGGSPAWRCSGTLLSPTVMLTAGHCTFGTSGGRVWFDSDVSAGRPGNGYPFSGGTGIEFAEIYTHPDYIDEAFYLYDVGVVILSEPVYLGSYGTLADVGLLDRLSVRRGQQDQSFTVVGYGLQSVVPTLQADLVRYQGTYS
jgi:hypothetical protein